MWEIQWGDKIDFLVDLSIEKGELRQSLKDRPVVEPENVLFWEAFAHTSPTRSHSIRFGKEGRQYIVAEGILLSEIGSFCSMAGITNVDQIFRVVRIVQKLDKAYRDQINPKVT